MPTNVKKIGKISINVISTQENIPISASDAEIDSRVKAAVHSALERARVCKKPIAKYDLETKQAYLEYANGDKKYVD